MLTGVVPMSTFDIDLLSLKPDEFFNDLLRIVGSGLNASRAYVFEYCEKTGTMSNTFEWSAANISCQRDKLQNIPVAVNPFWHEYMTQNKIINFYDVKDIPSFPENLVLMEQDIKSILVLPIHINNKYYGFWGVDECVSHRCWSKLEIAYMQAMTSFIRRFVAEREVRSSLDQ